MEVRSSWANNKCAQNSIDRLPDELIISITSRLPVKEAGRTSVLARRWRYFWTSNSILDFDASQVVCELENKKKSLESERIRFVGWVNGVLNLHSGETIEEFRILFDLDESTANDINRWIRFAFAKKVKRLALDLVRTNSNSSRCRQYTFPNICHPTECLHILPLGLSSCESLVSLYLIKVDVTGEVLEFFISKCPLLEELCVKDANGLECLRASCQPIRLRRLAIINCQGFRRLEICSPNLVSYSFYGRTITMALKNASSLIKLSLGAIAPCVLSTYLLNISGCLSRLETLMLQTSIVQGDKELEFPNLPRLKKLVFDINAFGLGSLLCFTSLINAAPVLCEIVFKLTPCMQRPRPIRRPKKGQRHECLKVLEIVGFVGTAVDVELAQYVLENAVSLEKVVINGTAMTGKGVDRLKAKLSRAKLIVR